MKIKSNGIALAAVALAAISTSAYASVIEETGKKLVAQSQRGYLLIQIATCQKILEQNETKPQKGRGTHSITIHVYNTDTPASERIEIDSKDVHFAEFNSELNRMLEKLGSKFAAE